MSIDSFYALNTILENIDFNLISMMNNVRYEGGRYTVYYFMSNIEPYKYSGRIIIYSNTKYSVSYAVSEKQGHVLEWSKVQDFLIQMKSNTVVIEKDVPVEGCEDFDCYSYMTNIIRLLDLTIHMQRKFRKLVNRRLTKTLDEFHK